jgi:YHS domain-containing protein
MNMTTTTTTLRRITLAIATCSVISSVFLLGGCAAIHAQNPSGNLRPVNAHVVGEQSTVMLKGYDVVSYFTQGKHAQGDAKFASTYENVNFHFANAEHKALFDKEPGKYIPQFGGYCANGVVYGIPWGGDADTWRIESGKLYIFGGKGSKDAFELDVQANLKLAQKYWDEEIKGKNSFIQRSKRIVFKVPHYKSGDELAKMVAAAKK